MKKSFLIRVSGKVQGVFFRKSTIETANNLDVKGFVRNEADGSVYIEAEGTSEQLKAFIEYCKEGPKGAKVDTVGVIETELKDYSSFEISYD